VLTLRFDMRSPEFGAQTPDLYRAALDMCAWAETRGAVAVILSEHHATEDGHLPSPMMLATATPSTSTWGSMPVGEVDWPTNIWTC
jgi:alkanesulfonate monooxygenase SsuD/methylene tetrahydromethanopterin reductase-like flavin-dependent oxidoreductase (luciferase family)